MDKQELKKLREESRLLKETAFLLKINPQDVPGEIKQLIETVRDSGKKDANKKEDLPDIKSLVGRIEETGGIKFLRMGFEGISRKGLLSINDKLRKEASLDALYLVSQLPEKVELIAGINAKLVDKGAKAGLIADRLSRILGGKGGGRPQLGQGGGGDSAKIKETLEEFGKIISELAGK